MHSAALRPWPIEMVARPRVNVSPPDQLETARSVLCHVVGGGDMPLDEARRPVFVLEQLFPKADVCPTVYATARAFAPPDALLTRGAGVILVPDTRWARCDIKSVNLLPNVLASQQAQEAGAYDAVFVREGIVLEGAHTSFAAVFDGALVTHPLTPHILPGITRAVVLELCRELDIPSREAAIAADALHDADELMLLGTTTEVMPVIQVDDWSVCDGHPGPVTRRLQQALRQKMVT